MVGNSEMNRFVCNDVLKHEFWGMDQAPIEREILFGGAISPFCALPHDVDPARFTAKAGRQQFEEPFHFDTYQPSEPELKAAAGRCLRGRPALDHYLSIGKSHAVAVEMRPRGLDLNSGDFSTE
jgi:hypothetical protein